MTTQYIIINILLSNIKQNSKQKSSVIEVDKRKIFEQGKLIISQFKLV